MNTQIRKKNMWAGIEGTVIIGPGFLHRASFNGLLIVEDPEVINSPKK